MIQIKTNPSLSLTRILRGKKFYYNKKKTYFKAFQTQFIITFS